MKKTILITISSAVMCLSGYAQKGQDKIKFKEYEPGFYQNSILKDIRHVDKQKEVKKMDKRANMVQDLKNVPTKVADYKNQWHNPTISQGNTGSCWAFSTTSFYETEVKRINKLEVKLSEMYTVYWEYVEKAMGFVESRGNTIFEQGSEANAVTRSFRKHGILPWSVYNGLPKERKYHTHAKMYKEMNNYLQSVKRDNAWNMDEVVATIKSIMNFHIGEPPAQFEYEGKMITPKEYLDNVLKLNMDDYIEVLSYMQEPYWKQVSYDVPDNWWDSKEYYNVPLDVFMDVVKKSIRDGYTCSIGGDVSEAGFDKWTQVALIPDFDIPSAYINEEARQFRFSNHTTTDDHGMHLVGYTTRNGKDFYLIKDSSSGSRNGDEKAPEFGYYFFSEDYVKLKMMGITIHKDAFKKYMKKFK
ncbi:MAG: C1 family peptidase [Hyphomicrobiales bacterium]